MKEDGFSIFLCSACFWDSFTVEGVEWTAHEQPYARTEDLGLGVGHPRCNGKDESNEEEKVKFSIIGKAPSLVSIIANGN